MSSDYPRFHQTSLIKKVFQVSSGTSLSRLLGLVRRNLLVNFLGINAQADAFNFSFSLSGTLRKIFAEGALSAALAPTLVSTLHQEGKKQVGALTTLVIVCFATFLILLCLLIQVNAEKVIAYAAPGFVPEQAAASVEMIKLLIFFIVFTSISAIFSATLQSIHRFFVAAHSQTILNMLFILQLLWTSYYRYSIKVILYSILFDGLVVVLMHVIAYKRAGLSFEWPTARTWKLLGVVLKKFIPCLITVGSIEVSLFVDRMFASYLPMGSISVLDFVISLINAPFAMIAYAFSMVLLPHMSYIGTYKPQRMAFYVLESLKFVLWVTFPVMVCMMLFSGRIAGTLLLSRDFTQHWITETASVLSIFSVSLLFFSFNRILTSVTYALHNTVKPTGIALITTVLNTGLNALLITYWGMKGIASALVISEGIKMILLMAVLAYNHAIRVDLRRLGSFFLTMHKQYACIGIPAALVYGVLYYGISYSPPFLYDVLMSRWGFWMWTGPLVGLAFGTLYLTRPYFGLKMYFLK